VVASDPCPGKFALTRYYVEPLLTTKNTDQDLGSAEDFDPDRIGYLIDSDPVGFTHGY